MAPPKSTRACERCRQHKARCLPGSSKDICANCEHSGFNCVVHVPVKRGLKTRQTIEQLSAQIAALQLALHEQSKLLQSSQRVQSSSNDIEHHEPTLGHFLYVEFNSVGVTRSQFGEIWDMTPSFIRESLCQYNDMAVATPFSLLVDTSDLPLLLQGSTVLALAALLVSPSVNTDIARQLGSAFHRVLTHQAMVQGQQNLDICGGLVTYLLWFHHRYDPETQQFFQYLQLAKAMVEDLQLKSLLRSGADMVFGMSRTSIARMLAGLYYVDQGTIILDTMRCRPPMSIDNAIEAVPIIDTSRERPVDFYAIAILDIVCCISSGEPDDATAATSDLITANGPAVCPSYIMLRRFSKVWIHVMGLISTPEVSHQRSEEYISAAEALEHFLDFVCQQPASNLATMTIVEWAYLLTALVKIPHLEGCALDDLLSGHTIKLIDKVKTHLTAAKQADTKLLEQSQHLWWLEGVLNDGVSVVSSYQDPLISQQMLSTSTYELLERLTERLTGFRKGIKVEMVEEPRDTIAVSQDYDNEGRFDSILAEWFDFEQP